MAENTVSLPPLNQPMVMPNGQLTKAWSIWFRDLHKRTSWGGGNAIDSLIGPDDVATEAVAGIVKQLQLIADVSDKNQAVVATCDPAPLTYSQASLQNVINLANANKIGINDLYNEINDLAKKINELLKESQRQGQMNDE